MDAVVSRTCGDSHSSRRTGRPGGHAPFRLAPTAANRQPAFAFYSRWQGPEWRFHSVQVLTLHGDTIAAMTSFVMPALASVFGLPVVLQAVSNNSDSRREGTVAHNEEVASRVRTALAGRKPIEEKKMIGGSQAWSAQRCASARAGTD